MGFSICWIWQGNVFTIFTWVYQGQGMECDLWARSNINSFMFLTTVLENLSFCHFCNLFGEAGEAFGRLCKNSALWKVVLWSFPNKLCFARFCFCLNQFGGSAKGLNGLCRWSFCSAKILHYSCTCTWFMCVCISFHSTMSFVNALSSGCIYTPTSWLLIVGSMICWVFWVAWQQIEMMLITE